MTAKAIFGMLARALLAAVGATVLAFVAYVLLLPAFIEHDPTGAAEPRWFGRGVMYGSLALVSGLSGFLRAGSGASLASDALLGLLIGSLLVVAWSVRLLIGGVPASELIPWDWYLPPLIAATASLLGGRVRHPGGKMR